MLGTVCGDIGDRGRSIELHSMALELSTKLGDRDGQCKAWSNLSVVFGDSGLYAEATACAARALELISSCDTDADDKRARVLTNMALARLCLGDVAEAAGSCITFGRINPRTIIAPSSRRQARERAQSRNGFGSQSKIR